MDGNRDKRAIITALWGIYNMEHPELEIKFRDDADGRLDSVVAIDSRQSGMIVADYSVALDSPTAAFRDTLRAMLKASLRWDG